MKSGRLIVVAGPPCSGKSTVAAALAKSLSVPHFDIDELAREVYPSGPWSEAARDAIYALMLDRSFPALDRSAVVLSATYGREQKRAELLERVHASGANLALIQCRVSLSVTLERFRQRVSHHASDLTEDRVRSLAEAYVYCENGLILNGEHSVAECLSVIETKWKLGTEVNYERSYD